MEFRLSSLFFPHPLSPKVSPLLKVAGGLRGSAPRLGLRAGLIAAGRPPYGRSCRRDAPSSCQTQHWVSTVGLVPNTASHSTGEPCIRSFSRLTWPNAAWEVDSSSPAAFYLLPSSRWILSASRTPTQTTQRAQTPSSIPCGRAGDAEDSRLGWGPGQLDLVGGNQPTAGARSCGVFEVPSHPNRSVIQ